ncbi:MAG: hypothetical protein MJ252_22705 [archaeon]|nr:hypothetical protein [archaeon]
MASYDTSCTTLSFEGRIYQLGYAEVAIENSSTVMGIIFQNGVVTISEKVLQSKAVVNGSNPSVYAITPTIGITICGLLPDGRNIVSRAKLEASSYLKTFGIEITGQILAERLSIYVHSHTCHWGARPFGACVFISSIEKKTYHLYMLETSGNFFEYYSCAHGKGRQFVKAEVEKDNFAIRNLNVREGLSKALKIMIKSFEGEKELEYDVGLISTETDGKFMIVGLNELGAFMEQAKKEIEEEKKAA